MNSQNKHKQSSNEMKGNNKVPSYLFQRGNVAIGILGLLIGGIMVVFVATHISEIWAILNVLFSWLVSWVESHAQ